MRQVLVLGTLLATACASRTVEPAPRTLVELPPPMTRLVLSPTVAPPANDISETKRLAWFESNRPRTQAPAVEREEIVVHEPARCCDRRCWDDFEPCRGWYVPLSIGLGFWGGHFGRHHGWGHGFGLSLGWRNGWGGCW